MKIELNIKEILKPILICKLTINENNQMTLWDSRGNNVQLPSSNNAKKTADEIKKGFITALQENEGKECKICFSGEEKEKTVLWFLCKEANGKIQYHQVGHNKNVESMFKYDIKPDVFDLCNGNEEQKGKLISPRQGKYYRLREKNCSFYFYSVDIDGFVRLVKSFTERGIEFDQEIIDALNKTNAINKTIRINCAEALLAFLLNCDIWSAAPQSGEEYYYNYFKDNFFEKVGFR